MSPGLILLVALSLLAGAVAAGLIRIPLRLEERAAVAVVTGLLGSGLATFILALATRLTLLTVLLAPVLLVGGLVLLAWGLHIGDPRRPWAESWEATRGRRRDLAVAAAVTGVSALVFGILFAHALFERDGAIVAGYNTVWADWSLHATLASSFVHGGNLPPHDPVFGGQTLLYPFLPDFHAATLQVAGAGVGTSLALPQVLFCTAIAVLVVSLGRRLCGSVVVGALAMSLCLLGGSLGFSAVVWDACRSGGGAGADCSVPGLARNPGLVGSTVSELPGVVAGMDHTRSYDNLENQGDRAQIGNLQWYTPLLAWWLPQRTFVAGFAVGVCVLLLVVAGTRAPPGTRSPWLAAGFCAGLLPLVHPHTLIALGVICGLLSVRRWRSEWLWAAIPCAIVATPRLLQLALGPHGSPPVCAAAGSMADPGTHFPYLEPGWLWNQGRFADDAGGCSISGRYALDPLGVARAVPRIGEMLLSPAYWLFWLFNTGVAFAVCVAVVAGRGLEAVVASGKPAPGRRQAASGLPDELVRFCLPFMAIFVLANLVVFQEWDWDNTKLLAWWYLGASLLVAAWMRDWWRRGRWRALGASVALLSLILSATLSLVRLVELEARGEGPPYTWAAKDARILAAEVEARTSPGAVLLTHGDPTDPLSTLAGRTVVLGYEGWVISYGSILGSRPADVATIYAGCSESAAAACSVPSLLARYHVDYVEVRSGGDQPDAAASWFARHYRAVAESPTLGVTLYDVRRS